MTKIEKLEWDPKYSVDIEEVDAHQKKMFDLFNQIIDIKQGGTDPKGCAGLVADLNEYSKLFFSTEEKYLKKKGYPDFASHVKAHRQFIKRAISLRREMAEDMENLTDEAIGELRSWLIDHILDRDALFVPFLRINRYIDEAGQKN